MTMNAQTFEVVFEKGGFHYDPTYDNVPIESMVENSRNINLHTGGREKRGGTAVSYSGFIVGNPQIMGIFNFGKKDGTVYTVIAADNGELWNGNTAAIKTGLTTGNFYSAETFNDKLYICNTSNRVQVWTGSGSTTDLTTVPVDWGTTSPRQIIKHGRGTSQRLWAVGVSGFQDNVYYSANNSDDFAGAGSGIIRIDTGDPYGIVGGMEFGDRLVLFSRNHSFVIDDTSTTPANWGYQQSQWQGGSASYRLMVKVPNDIFCMTEDGEIYSVRTAEQYGDYKYASVARPAFIHEWMDDYADFTLIRTNFHAIFDPKMNAVKWFIRRKGQSGVDTALVMYLDRPAAEAWSIHDNLAQDSGYKASVSAFGKIPGSSLWGILTGDYAGRIWKLEQAAANDNSQAYEAKFVTPLLSFKNLRLKKAFRRTHIVTKTVGNYNLTIAVYVDGVFRDVYIVSLAGTGSVYGTGQFGTAVYGSDRLMLTHSFDTRYVGHRIQYDISNNSLNEGFFVSRILTDYTPLGDSPSTRLQ